MSAILEDITQQDKQMVVQYMQDIAQKKSNHRSKIQIKNQNNTDHRPKNVSHRQKKKMRKTPQKQYKSTKIMLVINQKMQVINKKNRQKTASLCPITMQSMASKMLVIEQKKEFID